MSGLYVHIPWCVRKCPYCDFNSHERRQEIDEAGYVEALLQDYQAERKLFTAPISTVFIGGGTPSLFSAASIGAIISGLGVHECPEITMEVNPGTIERDDFAEYRNAGINRVSIGVQSFNPKHLKTLGRIHSECEAEQALRLAVSASFDSINIDLMFGLPHQSMEQALSDLQFAINLNPNHISWYQLTIEPNTVFGRNPPPLTSDDYRAEINEAGIELLASHGFEQYEVSAFARPGHQCQHNINYWQFGDYLGIGAGAHGKLSFADEVVRVRKNKQPEAYLKQIKRVANPISEADLPVEFMMNALRLKEGVACSRFKKQTGLDYDSIKAVTEDLVAEGVMRPDRLALTSFGFRHVDYAVGRYLN